MQSVAQDIKVSIRWMIRRDMPEVLAIESANFEFPWDEDHFIRCLRQRNAMGMVAERVDSQIAAGQIIGYMVYELHKPYLHLLNLAVHSGNHHRGVGRALIRKLADKLHFQRRNKIKFEVRESNLDGLAFLKAMGFRALGLLRNYYMDTDENSVEQHDDAILMQYKLEPPCTTK